MSDYAVGPNGNLLNASDIVWYNDPDDVAPISTPRGLSNQSPSPKIAGSHRPPRAVRPSIKASDPNNTKSTKVRKCKPEGTQGTRRVSRKVAQANTRRSSDDEHTVPVSADSDNSEHSADTHPEQDDQDNAGNVEANAAYTATKLMGDTDRQVR